MPSPATRTVLKMPVAMPARSLGTTLTARPSIKPQGSPMPRPISSSGGAICAKAVPGAHPPSHSRPAAQTSNPARHSSAAETQRVSQPASNGTNSMGRDSTNISCPACSGAMPSTPMKRTGSSTSSTTKA